jgi:hypothetical protein
MARGGARPGAGRPKTRFDIPTLKRLDALRRAAALGCNVEECATILGLARDTLYEHMKDPTVRGAYEEGAVHGRVELRELLAKQARRGNTPVLIFLAKARLGMSDRISIEPITVQFARLKSVDPKLLGDDALERLAATLDEVLGS